MKSSQLGKVINLCSPDDPTYPTKPCHTSKSFARVAIRFTVHFECQRMDFHTTLILESEYWLLTSNALTCHDPQPMHVSKWFWLYYLTQPTNKHTQRQTDTDKQAYTHTHKHTHTEKHEYTHNALTHLGTSAEGDNVQVGESAQKKLLGQFPETSMKIWAWKIILGFWWHQFLPVYESLVIFCEDTTDLPVSAAAMAVALEKR